MRLQTHVYIWLVVFIPERRPGSGSATTLCVGGCGWGALLSCSCASVHCMTRTITHYNLYCRGGGSWWWWWCTVVNAYVCLLVDVQQRKHMSVWTFMCVGSPTTGLVATCVVCVCTMLLALLFASPGSLVMHKQHPHMHTKHTSTHFDWVWDPCWRCGCACAVRLPFEQGSMNDVRWANITCRMPCSQVKPAVTTMIWQRKCCPLWTRLSNVHCICRLDSSVRGWVHLQTLGCGCCSIDVFLVL